MNTIRMRSVTLAAALLLTATPLEGQEGMGQPATDSARQAEVLDVVRGFHDVLASGDSAAALQALHPDVLIHESGHAETLDEYRSGHLPADIAFSGATDRVVTSEAVALWGDAALYTSESHTTGEWRGREIDAHGTETIVLVRTPNGWRIRHIHWSSRQ